MVRIILASVLVIPFAGCALAPRASPLEGVRNDLPRIERQRRAPSVTPAAGLEAPFVLAAREGGALHAAGEPVRPQATPLGGTFTLDDVPVDRADAHVPAAESSRRVPLPRFWDTLKRDVKDMPADLWSDTKKVYGSPTNLLILGLSYGGALALQEAGPDDTVEHSYRTHSTLDKDWRDTFNVLGNPGTHFALAGAWYLAGQQTQNEKTYNVGRKLFSALIITDLSTLLGQAASWDDAPNGEWGTFPSGHVSSMFAFASVMHQEYGPLAGVPLYGLGALVGISRLEDHEHYLSDVLFGGVLGLVVGHSVATDRPLELFGGSVLPYADPNTQSTGVAWWKKID